MYPIILGKQTTKYQNYVTSTYGSNLVNYYPFSEPHSGVDYLTFNGSTTAVNCDKDASINNLHDNILCVDGYWKATGLGEGDSGCFISKAAGASEGWNVAFTTATSLRVRVNCATTDAQAIFTFTPDSAWHHLTIFFNDAGDRKVYVAIDGTWVTSYGAQTTGAGAIVTDASRNLLIGDNNNAAHFAGSIGWVRISNSDRYDGTNETNFTPPSRTTIPTVDANTAILLPMDEGYGTIAGDISTNDNYGVITNGDWGTYPSANDISANDYDGTYTGATLAHRPAPRGIKGYAPFFDGVNDVVDIYDVGLDTTFNKVEGTFVSWIAKPDWSVEAVTRPCYISVDAQNRFYLQDYPANQMLIGLEKSDIVTAFNFTGLTGQDWYMFSCTWDASAPYFRAYLNGVYKGQNTNAHGTWVGNFNSNYTVIGAGSTSAGNAFAGWISHTFILDVAIDNAAMTTLYKLGSAT